MRSGKSEMLADRYRLGAVIGVGGMGSVMSAYDKILERPVAIKVLRDEYSADSRILERFRREARLAARLTHPGIAQVFDFQSSQGRHFIVMELLEGEDLHAHISSVGRLDPDKAARIIARAADALGYAHDQGAVHRDVKPSNIFLSKNGIVKVTDFGIARAIGTPTITAVGDVLGTAHYLSPEQIEGKPATPSSDVYGLGCTLYEALVGHPPYVAEAPLAVARAHISSPVPSAQDEVPAVPDQLDEVIGTALAKNPEQRFPSAAQMAAALRQVVGDPDPHLATASTTVSLVGANAIEAPPTITDVVPSQPSTPKDGVAYREPRQGIRSRPALAVLALGVLIAGFVLAGKAIRTNDLLPDLTGSSRDQAIAAAVRLGIPESQIELHNQGLTDRPEGVVVRQQPVPGTEISDGMSLSLFISEGIGRAVPDVKGKTLEDAEHDLEAAGFQVTVARRVVGDEDNIVIEQQPTSGTLALPGAEVKLTISVKEEDRGGKGKGKDD